MTYFKEKVKGAKKFQVFFPSNLVEYVAEITENRNDEKWKMVIARKHSTRSILIEVIQSMVY